MALLGCARSPGPPPLVVGMELAYPPFEMTDPQGRPAGVSVDLARALAESLGRPLRLENIPFDGLIPALKTGRIDLILSSMTATPERAVSIDFSEPYLTTGLALLVPHDADIAGVQDLNRPGRRVAVKLGTTGELFARSALGAATVNVLKEEAACVLEVLQGKADAFIYDQMSIFRHWSRNRDTTRGLLDAFQREAWAIGLRKGNDDLREQVNAFLADFRARGGFDELAHKHLAEMKQAFDEMGYDFVF
ncbi:MAG TPA: transporter substrate-binding domain-containing protein [Kiritimatiellia bacterium]|nr:transporter substrate-binding domain-containing protein [Kiritimatiellia bacterium]